MEGSLADQVKRGRTALMLAAAAGDLATVERPGRPPKRRRRRMRMKRMRMMIMVMMMMMDVDDDG